MNMFRWGVIILATGLSSLVGLGYAASTDVCIDDFRGSSELCLTVESNSYGYEMEIDTVSSDIQVLHCTVDVPGEHFVVLDGCEGVFNADEDDDFVVYVRANQGSTEYALDDIMLEFECRNGDCDVDNYDSNSGGSHSSSNRDADNFKVTADPDEADEDEWVDITVEVRDDDNDTVDNYDEDIVFAVHRRRSGSSTWYDVTSREGQRGYFEIDSDYDDTFDRGIQFRSSWDGEHEFNRFIKFDDDNYDYRVYVEDDRDEDVNGYDIVELDGNSSSNRDADNFKVTADPDEADEDEWVDITVEVRDDDNDTVDNYDEDIVFAVHRRRSGSSTWYDVTSREGQRGYFEIDSDYDDTFDRGIQFRSSWDGEHEFNRFIKFDDDNYDYRVYVEDDRDEDVNGYDIVELDGSASDVDGYSNRELDAVERVYDRWSGFIDDLERIYPSLRRNNDRQDAQEEFYDNLRDVVRDSSNKEWEEYDDFYDALYDFIEDTIEEVD